MNAVTVRRKSDNGLVAWGLCDGSYDPSHNPALHIKREEPDYEAVKAEWRASQPARVDYRAVAKQKVQDYLDGQLTARDALAAIKDAL